MSIVIPSYAGVKRGYQTMSGMSDAAYNVRRVRLVRGSNYGPGSSYARQRYYGGSRYYGRRRRNYLNFNRSMRSDPVYPRPEVKYFNFLVNTPQALGNQTAYIAQINQIAQGVTSTTRIGNQVATKNVYWQYVLQQGATPVPVAVRIMLIWDRQPNAGTVTATTIFETTGDTPPFPQYVFAGLNLDNRDRFVVLSDERYDLSPNGQQIQYIKGFRNINQRSTYTTSNPIPETGALILLGVSSATQATTANLPLLSGGWRIRFIDS